jgi:hypothetical protein
MRTHVLLLAACLASGCVAGMRDPFESTSRAGLASVWPAEGPHLAAAGETATHFEEVVVDETAEPAETEPKLPPHTEERARRGVCVRGGLLAAVGAERGGAGIGPLVGFSYGRPIKSMLHWEAGVDVVVSESPDVEFASTLLSGRFDVLLELGATSRHETKSRPYLVGGLGALLETASEDGEGYSNYAGALDLGVGVILAEDRLDVRAATLILMGSDNSPAFVQVSAAHRF